MNKRSSLTNFGMGIPFLILYFTSDIVMTLKSKMAAMNKAIICIHHSGLRYNLQNDNFFQSYNCENSTFDILFFYNE